jgi:hypothetical protein
MHSRQFRKPAGFMFLGTLIVFAGILVHAAPPADAPDASARTRLTAQQIREHIGKWLKPGSKFRDLTDSELMERFPEMRFPRERAEVIVHARRGNLVKTSESITIGQGTILVPWDGSEEYSVEIERERPDGLIGRIVPEEHAETVARGTRLRATDRRIRAPTWPPRKILAFVVSVNRGGAVLSPGINDGRLRQVLFSVYRKDGTLLGLAEILVTGGPDTPIDASPVSLVEVSTPIEKRTWVYLVPKSSSREE